MHSLAQRALNANAQEFSNAAEKCGSLLEQEREIGGTGTARVEGGLITIGGRGKLICVGDLHGDLEALSTILDQGQISDKLRQDSTYLLFLGDYGDRGRFSAEIYYTVFTLKIQHPDKVFLLRGNHEGPHDIPFYPYDLPYNFKERFGKQGDPLHQRVRDSWNHMHHALIVPGKYCFLHGGPPTEAQKLDEVAWAHRDHPAKSHLVEILWNDPREGITGTHASARGIGKYFGIDSTKKFLKMVGASTIIRGHEVCPGIKTNHDAKILTLFSCKEPYRNPEAAWLEIDMAAEPMDAEALAEECHFF